MHQLSSLSPVRNSAAIDGDRGIHPSERAKKHPLAQLATMAPSLSTTRPQSQIEETFGPFPHSQHKDRFPLMLQVTQAGPDDFHTYQLFSPLPCPWALNEEGISPEFVAALGP